MSKAKNKPLFEDKETEAEFSQWWSQNTELLEIFDAKTPNESKVLLFGLERFWYERINIQWHKTLALVKDQRELIEREIPVARRQGALGATLANLTAIEAQLLRKAGGDIRGKQQAMEKSVRHKTIQQTEKILASTTPARNLNKAIAKATGLETDYVRKARNEIKRNAENT